LYDAASRIHAPRHAVVLRHHGRTWAHKAFIETTHTHAHTHAQNSNETVE
jgi:hypothetical protein